MKVSLSNNIQQQNLTANKNHAQKQNQVSFKGAGFTAVLDYLATNPVWGATATDVLFMGSPTTGIEIYRRGWGYGFEAGFREYTSTLNDASVGLYGLGAGALLSGILTKEGIKNPQRIFASNESVDVHASLWRANEGNVDKYINEYVESIKGFNPNSERADEKGYVTIQDQELKDSIKEDMKKLTEDNLSKKERTKTIERLNVKLVKATGAESELVIQHGDKSVSSSVKTVTDDFYRMTRALKEHGNISKIDSFVSKLKNFGRGRAILGLGAAMIISACFQPINVWMSKKRTGSDGFGGDESRSKDNSLKFKLMKLGSIAGMIGIILATLKAKPSQFIDKMMYKGTAPTIDQFKGLYGITILSRMWMGRDKDELREIDIKSILGYLNWLVLGNFVEKGVALALESKEAPLIKYNKENSKNGFLYRHFGEKVDRFFNSDITSRREMISEAFAKSGKSVVNNDGTVKNMKQLLKEAAELADPVLNKCLKNRRIAQLANYAYAGVVLGAGVPCLNISLTNKATKKRLAKQEQAKREQLAQSNTIIDDQIKNTTFAQIKNNFAQSA